MTEAGRITAIIDGDISALGSKLAQARSQATSAASGIENDFKKGFGSGLQSSVSGITASMGPLGSAISGVSGGLGLAATAGLAGVAALGALGAASVQTAANWESLMAGISKTTGVEGAGLQQLSADLQQIRMETGATAEGIAGAVTAAGSIGIPTAELAGFSKVALQMGSAFSMSAETASTSMGKIGNVIKPAEMSWTEFATKAGSSINVLADSMATSEEQILTGMTHLGAVMGMLKPPEDTIPAWTALVATVQSLGLSGDQAGEAIQDALTYAAKNASSKDLGIDVAGLLGISGEQLQLDLRSNAPEVLQNVARAIAALPLDKQAAAMAMFGSTGSKAIALLMGDLNKTTGEFDKLGTAIDGSNKAWEEGSSLSGAYAKSQENFNAATGRLSASLDVAGQKLGTVFLPALTSVVNFLTDGVGVAIEFGEGLADAFAPITAIGGELLDPENWMGTPSDFVENLDDAFLSALGLDIGEKVEDSTTTGTEKGMEAGSEAAKGKVGDAVEEAVKVGVNDGFDTAKDALKKAGISEQLAGYMAAFDMSDAEALAAINRQSSHVKDTVIDTNVALQGQEYIIRNIATTQGSYYKLLSSSGAYIGGTGLMDTGALGSFNPTRWALSLLPKQSAILDSYLTFSKNIEGEIHDAGEYISQTYLDGMNFDTTTIADSIYNLKMLEFYDPEEAKAQGVDAATDYMTSLIQAVSEYDAAKAEYIAEPNDAEMKAKFEASLAKLDGIAKANPLKLKVDMDSVEVDFEVWLQEHGDLFVAQWENTKVMPIREQQFQRQQWELEAEKSNPNALKYLQLIDKAITSDEPGMVSGLYVYTAALLNAAPEIANTAWFTQELGSAQSELSQHVVNVNGTWIALDENGKALGETYLDTTIAAKGANGGLIRLQTETIATADAMASAARAAGSLDSVFGNYALSLRSNAAQSAQYDYLGSGGRTSWSNVFGNYTSQFSLPKFAEGAHVTGPTVALVGESGPETVIPDKYLQSGGYSTGFYPSTQKTPAANYWNALYDNSGTCVAFAEPDPSLKFTPPGSVTSDYVAVFDANGNPVAYAEKSNQVFSGISSGSAASSTSKTVSIDSSPAGALVTGLSKNGYVVTYDPRTDTCAGLPFNAPDPSLKTTDPFYLGLTKDSPAYKSVDEDGWGGVVAQALTPELAAMQEQYQQQIQESQRTAQATQQTATNTANMVSGISSLGSAISGALVSSGGGSYDGGGGSAIIGLANRGGGTVWGGTSISGGGSWIGTGATSNGWGARASNALRTTGSYSTGSFSAKGGSGSYQLPAIFRAKGGLIDRGPELAIVGEAGTEMILPPHVTQAVLGMTAKGGGAAPNITVNYSPTINGAGLSAEELAAVLEKDRAALIVEIAEASRGF